MIKGLISCVVASCLLGVLAAVGTVAYRFVLSLVG